MRICMPVEADRGLTSPLSDHFGSAPLFLIADSETGVCEVIGNRDAHHGHGVCQPLAVLSGHELDAVAVRGIGQGALQRLRAGNLTVYQAEQATAGEVLEALKTQRLLPMTGRAACAHHGSGPHAGHGEGHGRCSGGGQGGKGGQGRDGG